MRGNLFTIKMFVDFSLEFILDKNSAKRTLVGELYHDIIAEKLISIGIFLEGLVPTVYFNAFGI